MRDTAPRPENSFYYFLGYMERSRFRATTNVLSGFFGVTCLSLVLLSNGSSRGASIFDPQIRRPAPIGAKPITTSVSVCLSQGSSAIKDIDDAVCSVMTANGVPGASLAIVSGTKLVYARGYTYGPLGTPAVTPTTYFRQASVSKTITALAIFQLIEEKKLTLDTKMQDILHITQRNGTPPKDPRFNAITVRNLLEMDSGIDPEIMWSDVQIATALHIQLPITPRDAQQYAASQMLAYDPGTASKASYDNTNYTFLGDIVAAKRNAPSLADAIVQPLLKPLAITRIRSSKSLKSAQLPDEATYLKLPPSTGPSVMTQAQPQVPVGYGDGNLERGQGAGGLSAAATDMARILAMMNEQPANPAFKDPATLVTLLNSAFQCFHSSTPVAHGYYGFDGMESRETKGVMPPNTDYYGQKGGLLSSSQNAIYFERNGISYVLNWSGMTPTGPSWYPLFGTVYTAATKPHAWDGVPDQFPVYGMPSFTNRVVRIDPRPVLHLSPLNMNFMGRTR